MTGALAWLLPAAAVVCAVVVAACRLPRRVRLDRRGANVALYRQRRAELEQEADPALRGELEDELRARLLEDSAGEAPVAGDAREAAGLVSWPRAVLTGVLAALAAVLLYALTGEPGAPDLARAGTLLSQDIAAGDPRLRDAELAVADYLEQHPHDADAWFLLGQARSNQNRFAEAAMAFRHASLVGGHAVLLDMHWLAAAFASGPLDAEALTAGQRVLAQQPDHAGTLEILAVDSARRGDFDASAGFLERLMGVRREAGAAALVEELLAQVRERQDAARPLIRVTVHLPETPPPDPWLFVFARPGAGGPPAAVVRRPVRPESQRVELVLDDAVSMTAAMPLSAQRQVVVVARLTSGGTVGGASAAEAQSEPVAPGEQPGVSLRLDT